jgi:hypothetical protein
MSEVVEKMSAIMNTKKALEAKEREIEKRREVFQTTESTNLSKIKDEAKVDAIDHKITTKELSFEKTINYYRDEITKSEKKFNEDLETLKSKITSDIYKLEAKLQSEEDTLQKKFEAQLQHLKDKFQSEEEILRKKFENNVSAIKNRTENDKEALRGKLEIETRSKESRFNTYRDYCHKAMKFQDEKKDVATQPLEKRKELLQQTFEKTEDDDRVLVRLKIEKRQLEELEKELTRQFTEACRLEEQKNQRRREAAQREILEQMAELKRQEDYQRQQEFERLQSEREAQRQKDEERWAQQKVETIESEKMKEKDRTVRIRFNSKIYPSLDEKATAIYDFFKKSDDVEIYKEAMKKETVESCQEYLLEHQGTYDLVTTFESEKYPEMSSEAQTEYDNKTLWKQVSYIQQLDKKDKKKKK